MRRLNLIIESCDDCPFKIYNDGEPFCVYADKYIDLFVKGIDSSICLLPSNEEE